MRVAFTIPVLALWVLAFPADAEESFDFGEVVEETNSSVASDDDFDFGDGATEDVSSGGSGRAFPLAGWIRVAASRQVDGDERWIDLGPAIGLRLDLSGVAGQLYGEGSLRMNFAYRLEGDSESVVQRHEFEPWLRELYWRRAFGPMTLTVGQVITTWGVTDLLPVIDRLSITDQARAFFADPEDIYSGQLTVATDFYAGAHRWTLIVVPYPLFDRVRDGEHPYSVTPGERLDPEVPSWMPELAARYGVTIGAVSLGFAGGYVRNREPILTATITNEGTPDLRREHRHYGFAGMTLTAAIAPVLLKLEVAVDIDRPVQGATTELSSAPPRVNQLTAAAGLDVNLGRGGTLLFEGRGQFPFESDDRLATNRPTWQAGVAWTASFFNDTLDLAMVLLMLDSYQNIVARAEVGYDITDAWRTSVRYTGFFIHENVETYGRLDRLDRVDLTVELSF